MAKRDSVEMLEAKIKLLNCARKLIKSGKNEYICVALRASRDSYYGIYGFYGYDVVRELKSYISNQLGDCTTLDEWIKNRSRYKNLNQSLKAMRKYRLQWIDWMLSCLREDLASKTANTR